MMDKIKNAQQASSVGPLPPNVQQALSGEPAAQPAEGEAPAPEGATPTEEPAPVPAVEPQEPTAENFPELFGPPSTEGETSAPQ
jgi:hypothetical protein